MGFIFESVIECLINGWDISSDEIVSLKQTYLQSTTTRLEEMRVKRRDAEQWMSHRLLPENLRERIRRYEQYRWQETRGVDEENLICNLPKDLRRDIKRHLCLALLMRVSLSMILVILMPMTKCLGALTCMCS